MVEYEIETNALFKVYESDPIKLKVNPKDNTITIKKVKESWNREEAIELCKKSFDKGLKAESFQLDMDFNFYNWIEQNL